MPLTIMLHSEENTLRVANALGCILKTHKQLVIIHLDGVLGAGKTTFCRGVLQAFGHVGAVKSPTYTLVEPYEFCEQTVYHFDLYRLGDPHELDYMGIRDYYDQQCVCLIEWPDRGAGFLPEPDLLVNLVAVGESRRMVLKGISSLGESVVGNMRKNAVINEDGTVNMHSVANTMHVDTIVNLGRS